MASVLAKVVVTENAKQDVRDILTDVRTHQGYAVAARYAADFKAVYRNLAQWPGSGPPRREFGANTRIKIVTPYLFFYDHEGNTATVLRVLHGSREITAKFLRR
jgi:plasmid stabilization system protein ParE